MADILMTQQAFKTDLVTPITNLRSENGVIRIEGTSVFEGGTLYRPTPIADSHIAEKLGIPVAYVRRMREERPDLYDVNVNGWIHGNSVLDLLDGGPVYDRFAPPDQRRVLCRLFQGDEDEVGWLRAMLSDSYQCIDNLDYLLAFLDGIKRAGIDAKPTYTDLTETRMIVKIAAPEIAVNAPQLMEGYRSPFHGKNLPEWVQERYGVNSDGVGIGLVGGNSETGGGSAFVYPVLYFLACMNGLVVTKDVLRKVHLGGKLQEGVIEWSGSTQRKALELVTSQVTDAVSAFLNPEYIQKQLDEIAVKAGKKLANPDETIKVVAKQLNYTEAEASGILRHFILGGQVTAGGVLQAVTSFAQELADPDAAWELELSAMKALDLAYAAA
jgi:hypothetical protein